MRILIVDDELHNREAVGEVLTRMRHEVTLAEDGRAALDLLSGIDFDLVLSDVRMPRMSGYELFSAAQDLKLSRTRFAFMTAYGRLDDAVEMMRKGAIHFLSKPIRKKDLSSLLEELEKLIANSTVAEPVTSLNADGEFVYKSRAFADVVATVDRVATSLASVIFVGESGTGKELLARRLHQKSNRNSKPFIPFHAGATPETLFESELFGYERGAFTGADRNHSGLIRSAQFGTFFLDEISSMPLNAQAKLLRVIQEREVQPLGGGAGVSVDVRWVSATNIALEEQVRRGQFREDLMYRLQVVMISVPALRDRPEDIECLVEHYNAAYAVTNGREPLLIGNDVRSILQSYIWPGNVRELRNVMERAHALASGPELTRDLLPGHIQSSPQGAEVRFSIGTSLEAIQDKIIEETLRSCNGDKTLAASLLGVNPRTIYRWLEKR